MPFLKKRFYIYIVREDIKQQEPTQYGIILKTRNVKTQQELNCCKCMVQLFTTISLHTKLHPKDLLLPATITMHVLPLCKI